MACADVTGSSGESTKAAPGFRRNALTMLVGSGIAQVIPIALMPVFTRVYEPEAIGLQALFVAWAGAFCVIATLRLDLAIVVPKGEQTAAKLVHAIVRSTLVWVVVMYGGIVVFGDQIRGASGYDDSRIWAWLLPLMVIGMSASAVATGLATRRRRFSLVAKANIVNQLVFGVTALVLGLTFHPLEGLVVAKALGFWAMAIVQIAGIRIATPYRVGTSAERVRSVVWRYRQFLFFNTPYSLFGSIARDLPTVLAAALLSPVSAAMYGLAKGVTMVPTMFVSASLSQVVFKEAADRRGTPELERLVNHLLRLTMIGSVPVFAVLAVWGDYLFGFVFGDRWTSAGQIAMILAPALWMSLQSSWPERLYEVANAQHISFCIQIVSDLITIGLVAGVLVATQNIYYAAAASAGCLFIYNLSYLAGILKVYQFSWRYIGMSMTLGQLIMIVTVLLFLALRIGDLAVQSLACVLLAALSVVMYRQVAGSVLELGRIEKGDEPSVQ